MSLPAKSLHVRHYVQTDDAQPRLFDAYYRSSDAPAVETMFDVCSALALSAYNGMLTAMGAWLASDSKYLGCTAHLYANDIVAYANNLNYAGEPGDISGDTLPDHTAAVIRRYTASPGPAGRGRVFIPAVAEVNSNTSRTNSDGLAALILVKTALSATLNPGGEGDFEADWLPAHYNRKNATMWNVLKWAVQDTFVTQRRRRLRPLQ